MKKEELYQELVSDFFAKPEFIKNIMVEVIALRMLLISKGIVTQEEVDQISPALEKKLKEEVQTRIEESISKDKVATMFMDLLAGTFRKKNDKD